MRHGALFLLAGLGLLVLAAHGALAATAPWRDQALLFRALVACAATVSALPALPAFARLSPRAAGAVVLAVSAALHLCWIPVAPSLSDDVARYRLEGQLVRRGISPYAAPPADRAPVPGPAGEGGLAVGHPELSTIYPPLSLAAFAVGEALGGVRGMKLLFGAASWAAAACLVLWLVRRGLPPTRAALYAWAPLPALEFAGQGHHDALGLFFLALAMTLVAHRPQVSGLAWGLSAAVKGATLVTLPAFWRAWPPLGRGVAVAVAGLGLLPLLWLSSAEHSGWRAYLTRWSYNAPVYSALAWWLESEWVIRAVLAALFVAGALAVHAARLALPAAAAATTALALVLSPTAHPWYVAWGLLWAPLAMSGALWALGLTALWTYAPLGGAATPGHAPVSAAWLAIEWGVPLAIGLVELWRWRARRAIHRGETT